MSGFETLGDGYRPRIDGLELVLTRVRRQRLDLVSELAIVNATGETLSEATFNVSDLRPGGAVGTHLATCHRQDHQPAGHPRAILPRRAGGPSAPAAAESSSASVHYDRGEVRRSWKRSGCRNTRRIFGDRGAS